MQKIKYFFPMVLYIYKFLLKLKFVSAILVQILIFMRL